MRFDFPIASELNRLQNEMDRVFGVRLGGPLAPARAYPPVNLWEDDDYLYVESEIPGMKLDQIELFVSDEDQLTIQGERKSPQDDTAIRQRGERAFGRFSRVIALPTGVDADQTTAEYKAGVLTVRLAKKEEAKPKRITVSAG